MSIRQTNESTTKGNYMAVEIPTVLTDELTEKINRIGTATLTFQMQRRGILTTFLAGLKPMHPGKRMVGRARTLRYVALREDVQPE